MMEAMLTDIWRPFDSSQEKKWGELTTELNKTVTGLRGISISVKGQVVAGMGPTQGHWYSCPNGHVYNIGNCGGDTVESNCPDCHERWIARLRMTSNHANANLNRTFLSGLEDQDTVDLLQLIRQITWRAQDEKINSGGLLKDKSKDKFSNALPLNEIYHV